MPAVFGCVGIAYLEEPPVGDQGYQNKQFESVPLQRLHQGYPLQQSLDVQLTIQCQNIGYQTKTPSIKQNT
jgi:hypothetical protein